VLYPSVSSKLARISACVHSCSPPPSRRPSSSSGAPRPFRDWVFLTRCARVRRVPATLTAKARLSYPGRPCRSPVRPVCLRSASRSSLVASAVLADAKRDAEPARLLRALSQAGMVAVVSHRSAGLPSDSRDAARRNEKRGFRGRWLAP
jgi:hypothetical protein